MINNRQSFRLHQQFDVFWSIPAQNTSGEGLIFNISRLGMLFVTDKLFKAQEGLLMHFNVPQTSFFPSQGRLVWFRKVGRQASQYQCGVQFVHDAAHHPLWIKWMEDNILKLAEAADNKILDRLLNEE